jgi:hypothetical protein
VVGGVAAGRWQGSAGGHQGAPWRAPVGGGNGGLTEETTRRAGAERRRCEGAPRPVTSCCGWRRRVVGA